MLLINRTTVHKYALKHASFRSVLKAWEDQVVAAEWTEPGEVVAGFPSASIVGSDRAVFRLKGNQLRLVVVIQYKVRTVKIRFVGTHAEYNKIDAATI